MPLPTTPRSTSPFLDLALPGCDEEESFLPVFLLELPCPLTFLGGSLPGSHKLILASFITVPFLMPLIIPLRSEPGAPPEVLPSVEPPLPLFPPPLPPPSFLLLAFLLPRGSGDAAKGNGERTEEGFLRTRFVGDGGPSTCCLLPPLPPALCLLLLPSALVGRSASSSSSCCC